uniref:UPAR/Ly6 domain-containing protein n=1 Tax=Leptobrachium leishanense TaxID=445787 RepID=A0A8C5WJM0_9ANUR
MRSVLGFLGVLLAVIRAGHALSCIQCVSLESTYCIGPSVSCPPDNVCGTSYTETSLGSSVFTKIYVRGCFAKNKCNLQGSTSVINDVMRRIGSTCCEINNCTPSKIILPDASTRLNGLVCRTCISANSGWCDTDNTLQCTGDENMCLLQTTSITGAESKTYAYRGCATKSLCDIGRQTEENAGQKVDERFTCTSGTAGLYSGLTLPLIAILTTSMFS